MRNGITLIGFAVLGCCLSPAACQTLEEALQGVPGQDYPIYAEVPDTGFTCDGRIDGGYYADPQTQCQVFHVCSNNIRYSFLCPNGTVFSQLHFICDWWYNFDCNFAEQLYVLNELLFTDQEFDGRRFAQELGILSADSTLGLPSSGPSPSGVLGGVLGASGPSGVLGATGASAFGGANNGAGFNGNGNRSNGNGNRNIGNGNRNNGNRPMNGVSSTYGAPGK